MKNFVHPSLPDSLRFVLLNSHNDPQVLLLSENIKTPSHPIETGSAGSLRADLQSEKSPDSHVSPIKLGSPISLLQTSQIRRFHSKYIVFSETDSLILKSDEVP